ncbi:nucleotide exchange factor GrpE [Pseudonocardia sp. CA-107938]|uniref:nucleotide exchange factor GrpE n=1 Tax=Pseudonocardia sp. CA-107938 TaxID=3240021 RepID=UPI003D91246D
MSDHDRNERAGNGEAERVVVRDRRRIDPVTGQVRTPPAADEAAAGADPTHPADSASSAGFHPPGPGATPEPAGPSVAEAELAAQVAERTADLQRITAEYANYRRRVDRDREAVLTSARVQFVGDLLTVLDDLERAEAHGDLTGAFKSVGDKVVSVVQKLGLEAFGHEGEPFDPSVHEAVQHEPSDATGPTTTVVVSVLRRGYRIADRVLRPAMVTVTDRAENGTSEPAPEPEQG